MSFPMSLRRTSCVASRPQRGLKNENWPTLGAQCEW